MTSLHPSVADRNRDNAATNLTARHLAERAERHIKARQVAGRLVWQVESQTEAGKVYTVTTTADGWEADTCSCPDHVYRHEDCKHLRAVRLLAGQPTPAPKARARRTEWQEEV